MSLKREGGGNKQKNSRAFLIEPDESVAKLNVIKSDILDNRQSWKCPQDGALDGLINMHGDKRGSGSECVSEGRRGEREEEEGEGEEEEGGGERGPLNANKTLKAYLQYVIPTAQLGFSL